VVTPALSVWDADGSSFYSQYEAGTWNLEAEHLINRMVAAGVDLKELAGVETLARRLSSLGG